MNRLIPIFLLVCSTGALAAHDPDRPTVGMEGRETVTLPGTRLEAKPVDEKSPIALRIASSVETAEGILYDLRYQGFVPGKHDLKNYLVRADGSPMTNVPPIPVEIVPVLPPDHRGELIPEQVKSLPFLGGYAITMGIAAGVWVLLLIPILLIGRKKKVEAAAPTERPLTLADRLRPLVEEATTGKLSADRQAELERLLLWHWRTKLNLADTDVAQAIITLRRHEQAGALLRALEGWLHRPPGSAHNIDVAAVLAPYRDIPAEQPREKEAALA